MATNPYDQALKRAGALDALQTPDPYAKYQGGVSFPSGPVNTTAPAPVSTTMPVPDPNTPAPSPGPRIDTTQPDREAAALTGHRDQWSSPFNVATRGDVGRLSGFDAAKLGGDEQTLKYQAGRQFSGFDPTKGVSQLFADPEFTKLFPNAKPVGEDKIDWGFGDLPLDAIQDYGTPNAKWAWQPGEGTAAPASAAAGGTGGGLSPAAATATATPQSSIQNILAEITAIANNTKSPAERKAILDLLQPNEPEQILVP